MSELHVLRVFVTDSGAGGNPLGVFLGDGSLAAGARQRVAARLGYSETVWVQDRQGGTLRIHTPRVELPFAGHPLVGTAWLLAYAGHRCTVLRPPAGEVGVRQEASTTWISADPAQSPDWDLVELEDPAAVDALAGAPDGLGHVCCWAWEDEGRGTVRSRVFAADYGVAEDPATGSASIRLCAELGRALDIHQGRASTIRVAPLEGGRVELGGRVSLVEVREEVED